MLLITSIVCSHLVFVLGLYGLFTRKDNLIITMVCLEVSLLGVALLFVTSSLFLDDIAGVMFFFNVLILAGVESALGLALVIVYYRSKTSVGWSNVSAVKG